MIGRTVSHYKILEQLGQGGMGVVYKALDLKLNRTVALKFLPPHLTQDQEAIDRFINEAQAASALDHANICTIHEINETEEGQLYIVMAYYAGETLEKKVASGKLQVTEAIQIAIQTAQGLLRAHEAGITHRDIKPSNLIITLRGEVKIIDFGLVKLAGPSQSTKTGNASGTVAYMSPEQAQGKAVDHRTDIWSPGVVLYEMLAGELPFQGIGDQAVIFSIVNEDPRVVTALRQETPAMLVQLVHKAMQKNPADRQQTMAELISMLIRLKARLETTTLLPEEKQISSIVVLPFADLSP
ncbi:MAG: serine/threonine-protein kinase, partial [bacterium]